MGQPPISGEPEKSVDTGSVAGASVSGVADGAGSNVGWVAASVACGLAGWVGRLAGGAVGSIETVIDEHANVVVISASIGIHLAFIVCTSMSNRVYQIAFQEYINPTQIITGKV